MFAFMCPDALARCAARALSCDISCALQGGRRLAACDKEYWIPVFFITRGSSVTFLLAIGQVREGDREADHRRISYNEIWHLCVNLALLTRQGFKLKVHLYALCAEAEPL
jgi:hypothetical protein